MGVRSSFIGQLSRSAKKLESFCSHKTPAFITTVNQSTCAHERETPSSDFVQSVVTFAEYVARLWKVFAIVNITWWKYLMTSSKGGLVFNLSCMQTMHTTSLPICYVLLFLISIQIIVLCLSSMRTVYSLHMQLLWLHVNPKEYCFMSISNNMQGIKRSVTLNVTIKLLLWPDTIGTVLGNDNLWWFQLFWKRMK